MKQLVLRGRLHRRLRLWRYRNEPFKCRSCSAREDEACAAGCPCKPCQRRLNPPTVCRHPGVYRGELCPVCRSTVPCGP